MELAVGKPQVLSCAGCAMVGRVAIVCEARSVRTAKALSCAGRGQMGANVPDARAKIIGQFFDQAQIVTYVSTG